MKMKQFLKQFISKFQYAYPMYIWGVSVSLILYFIHHQPLSFIFITIGPIQNIMLIYFKPPIKTKLEILDRRFDAAANIEDPIKQSIMFSMIAQKNCMICAMESNKQNGDSNHWRFMSNYYNDIYKIHREAAHKLMAELRA